MSRAHVRRPERHEPAAADVVAERHGPEQFFPGSIVALAHGDRRGTTALPGCAFVTGSASSVSLGVGEHRVRQRGIHRGGPDGGREHRRLWHAALCSDVADGHRPRFAAGSRHHRR
jgi:hypothetical protein